MEDDIHIYLSIVMFRGTPCIKERLHNCISKEDTGCSDNFVFILSIEISTLFSIAPKVSSSKVKIDENFATYLSRATKV